MDIVRALKFPFDDENWVQKFIIGTLLSFIPILAQGYQVNVARNVIRSRPNPLPGSQDLGQVVTDGIMAAVASLVYALPILPFACLLSFPSAIMGDSDTGTVLFCFAFFCLFIPMMAYGIVASTFYWMGILRYAETGNFSSFVQFGALWNDIRTHLDVLIRLLLYSILIGLGFAMISPFALITVIGIPLIIFYSQIAIGHLIGQAGREIVRGW